MPLIRFSALSLSLAAFSLSLAAQNAAWFGTPVPPPLSDPRKPIMKHDDAFGPLFALPVIRALCARTVKGHGHEQVLPPQIVHVLHRFPEERRFPPAGGRNAQRFAWTVN